MSIFVTFFVNDFSFFFGSWTIYWICYNTVCVFWQWGMWGILVPGPEIKPTRPALEGSLFVCLFILVALGLWRRLLRVPWTARRSRSWNSNTLAIRCEEMTHWKRPWHWERLKAGGEGGSRGWDGWMASPTRWTWVWASSGSWWWTGRPGVLQAMGSQRVRHDWATELNWVSLAVCVRSLAVMSGSSSPPQHGRLTVGPLSVQSAGSQAHVLGLTGFRSCSAWAYLLFGLRDLPRPGIEPVPLHWQTDSYPLDPQGSPCNFQWGQILHKQSNIAISKVWSKPEETFYLNKVLTNYLR